ncbi:MAG: hypothetical protein QW706_09680 [Candidatus Nezhaarchaeales archaeon]
MVDFIDLSPNESAVIDTTANIVSLISNVSKLEVYKEGEGDPMVILAWGEIYSLGVSQGRFIVRNTSSTNGRIYIVRQYIL